MKLSGEQIEALRYAAGAEGVRWSPVERRWHTREGTVTIGARTIDALQRAGLAVVQPRPIADMLVVTSAGLEWLAGERR